MASEDYTRDSARTYGRTWPRTVAEPSLFLNFTSATSLDPRITFSRGSQATLFDSTGTLVYAKHNLLTQSEDAVTWTPSQLSVSSNSILAPNGTLTADTLTEDTTTNFHRIQPSTVTFVSGFQYTFSVFLKNGDRNFAQLFFPLQFSTADYANFDISTGALGTVGGSATASIVSVGSGWYRCSVTATATSSGTGAVSIGLITSATASRAESYLGASKFIYVWGIQLNLPNMEGGVTSSLTTYYPTTTAAYYAPRFDYDPSTLQPRGLLIEEQRTNNALQSQDFASGDWTKSNSSITSNTEIAPDGTLTADVLTGNGTLNAHGVQNTGVVSFIAAPHTLSVFAKAGTNNFIQLRFFGVLGASFANFDLVNGVVGTSGNGGSGSIQSVGNGWYRCAMTATTSASASGGFNFLLVTSASAAGAESNTLSTSVYIWGAQLEAGAFATSYIPTTTTALTRNADAASMTGTNFSSWYNQSEGTLLVTTQYASGPATAFTRIATISDNTTNNFSIFRYLPGVNASVQTAGSIVANLGNITTFTNGQTIKLALATKANDFEFVANGSSIATDTSGAMPTVDRLYIGANALGTAQLNSTISRISYYPVRLASSTMQALTS